MVRPIREGESGISLTSQVATRRQTGGLPFQIPIVRPVRAIGTKGRLYEESSSGCPDRRWPWLPARRTRPHAERSAVIESTASAAKYVSQVRKGGRVCDERCGPCLATTACCSRRSHRTGAGDCRSQRQRCVTREQCCVWKPHTRLVISYSAADLRMWASDRRATERTASIASTATLHAPASPLQCGGSRWQHRAVWTGDKRRATPEAKPGAGSRSGGENTRC